MGVTEAKKKSKREKKMEITRFMRDKEKKRQTHLEQETWAVLCFCARDENVFLLQFFIFKAGRAEKKRKKNKDG